MLRSIRVLVLFALVGWLSACGGEEDIYIMGSDNGRTLNNLQIIKDAIEKDGVNSAFLVRADETPIPLLRDNNGVWILQDAEDIPDGDVVVHWCGHITVQENMEDDSPTTSACKEQILLDIVKYTSGSVGTSTCNETGISIPPDCDIDSDTFGNVLEIVNGTGPLVHTPSKPENVEAIVDNDGNLSVTWDAATLMPASSSSMSYDVVSYTKVDGDPCRLLDPSDLGLSIDNTGLGASGSVAGLLSAPLYVAVVAVVPVADANGIESSCAGINPVAVTIPETSSTTPETNNSEGETQSLKINGDMRNNSSTNLTINIVNGVYSDSDLENFSLLVRTCKDNAEDCSSGIDPDSELNPIILTGFSFIGTTQTISATKVQIQEAGLEELWYLFTLKVGENTLTGVGLITL